MRLPIDHFGIIAPLFERIVPARVPEKLLALVRVQPGSLVLDAGGGTGRIARFLHQAGAAVVVADPSHRMLQQAGRKEGLMLVCTPIEKAPFPGGCFDRVLMVDALHHAANQAAGVGELWRLVRPGGCILIEEPNFHHWLVKLVAVGENLLLMGSRFLTPERIAGLFSFPGARPVIHMNGTTAWIMVEKEGT